MCSLDHSLAWALLCSWVCTQKGHVKNKHAKPPKPQTISSFLTELDFVSHGCGECCTPSEVRGDYKCSASQERRSVPHRLICQLIHSEHALGELWGQQNTICRAGNLIKRRSGTRLLPDNCYVRSRRANRDFFVIRPLTFIRQVQKALFFLSFHSLASIF